MSNIKLDPKQAILFANVVMGLKGPNAQSMELRKGFIKKIMDVYPELTGEHSQKDVDKYLSENRNIVRDVNVTDKEREAFLQGAVYSGGNFNGDLYAALTEILGALRISNAYIKRLKLNDAPSFEEPLDGEEITLDPEEESTIERS